MRRIALFLAYLVVALCCSRPCGTTTADNTPVSSATTEAEAQVSSSPSSSASSVPIPQTPSVSTLLESTDATTTTTHPPTTTTTLGAGVETCSSPTVFSGGGSEAGPTDLISFDADATERWRMRLPGGAVYWFVDSAPFILVGSPKWGYAAIDPATCNVLWEVWVDTGHEAATAEVSLVIAAPWELIRVTYDFKEVWRFETETSPGFGRPN